MKQVINMQDKIFDYVWSILGVSTRGKARTRRLSLILFFKSLYVIPLKMYLMLPTMKSSTKILYAAASYIENVIKKSRQSSINFRTTAGWDNVGQVGQLLDHDNGIVEGRLEESRNGVGNQNGDHYRDNVANLARHFRYDDADGNGMGHTGRKRGSSDDGVTSWKRGII